MNRFRVLLTVQFALTSAFAQDYAYPDPKLGWVETPSIGKVYIVVDKIKNSLSVRSFDDRRLVLREYHSISGTNSGDKEREGDKKTPEGIYFIERKVAPSRLTALHGAAALELNYPNPVDKINHRTGSGIWIHGVDREERLQKRFDTLGCVAISNADISDLANQLSSHLQFRNTPVVITSQESPDVPLGVEEPDGPVRARVQAWVDAWSSKDAALYLSFYSQNFVGRGMPMAAWIKHKTRLTKSYKYIKVTLDDLQILRHGKYSVAVFKQNYQSDLFKSRSLKRLYLVGDSPAGSSILAEEIVAELPVPPEPIRTAGSSTPSAATSP